MSEKNSDKSLEETTPFQYDNNSLKLKFETNLKSIERKESWLLRRIHILSWIKSYDSPTAIADLIAGVTLGLTLIPQSIAYAALAGLSPQYGLYSAFAGSFAYVIFGTIPQVSVGPTSLMALLTLKYTYDHPIEFTVMLAFVAGIIELGMGILNLGFIVKFISQPVNSAFTTATSIVIIKTQIKNLMGIKTKYNGLNPIKFLSQASIGDCSLGFVCIGIILILRQLNALNFKTNSRFKEVLKKGLWYISISRNAIVVFFSSLLAYYLSQNYDRTAIPFALTKHINGTMPSFKIPSFVIEHENVTYSFFNILTEFGSGIFVVPIIAVLANVAIAKAFAKELTVDASQEMLTLGICNIVGSFFSSMPTCGAFTRSAVSEASGVKTPFAGIYSGALVLLALGVLTSYFEYIPKTTLSAILISAVMFMVDFKTFMELWRSNKKDFLIWIAVFSTCITIGVEVGLFLGIIANFALMTINLANPRIDATLKCVNGSHYIHITPISEIYYSGADNFRDYVKSICAKSDIIYPVVIDCKKLNQDDYTIVMVLKKVIQDLQGKNIQVHLQNIKRQTKKCLTKTETNVMFYDNDFGLLLSCDKVVKIDFNQKE